MPKHIVRLIVLIVAFGAAALIAKSYFTVDSFYEFGHYRANSVPEIAVAGARVPDAALLPGLPHRARRAVVGRQPQDGDLRGVPWRGPGASPERQAADSQRCVKLCTLCHEAMPGRPHTQPQIEVAQHSGGQQCTVCHNPHSPKICAATAKVAGDAAAGKQRAAACASCHGADGISPNDTWPNLAGQNAAYLARILAAYKSGDQTGPDHDADGEGAQRRRHPEPGGVLRRPELQGGAQRDAARRCGRRQGPGEELRGLPRRNRHRDAIRRGRSSPGRSPAIS